MDYNTLQIQKFNQRCDVMIDFLDQLLQRTEGGELPPLGTLDHDIDMLCKEVKAAAPEIAREILPVIAHMISKLDELAGNLHRHRQNLMTENKD